MNNDAGMPVPVLICPNFNVFSAHRSCTLHCFLFVLFEPVIKKPNLQQSFEESVRIVRTSYGTVTDFFLYFFYSPILLKPITLDDFFLIIFTFNRSFYQKYGNSKQFLDNRLNQTDASRWLHGNKIMYII